MRHILTRAVLVVALTFAGSVAQAQIKATVPPAGTPPWEQGIGPISAESYWNAIECGKQGGEAPACVFFDNGFCANDDFVLALFTPYKFVAYNVWQAVRRKQPPPTPSYAEAQRTRVVIGVTPARGSTNPISELVIRRGGQVVAPATRTLDGGGGTFIFDFAPFAPTASITIEMKGKQRTQTCTVSPAVLRRLR